MKTLRLLLLFLCLSALCPVNVKADIPPGTVRVTAPVIKVRVGPGMGFEVVGSVEEGTLLKVLEIRGGWLRVRRPAGVLGWVPSAGTIRVN